MERTSLGEPLEHRHIEVDGIRLHTVLTGPDDGPPVVLLHGFPEFWYSWRHQLGPLAQAGYRVIAPDLRGYNLSSKPSGVRHYERERLQADVVGLLDRLGIPQAHVVGHDWGGLLAWWLAESQPARVQRLVILNAPHPQVFQQNLRQQPSQLLRSSYMLLFQLPMLPELVLQQNNYWIMTQTLKRTSRAETFSSAELNHYREAWAQPGALTAMLAWYRALPRYAMRAGGNGQISVPTLIVWGERDFALGQTLAAASLAKCENGRLQLLPRAGHWLQHEEPAQVNKEILSFLAEDPLADQARRLAQ